MKTLLHTAKRDPIGAAHPTKESCSFGGSTVMFAIRPAREAKGTQRSQKEPRSPKPKARQPKGPQETKPGPGNQEPRSRQARARNCKHNKRQTYYTKHFVVAPVRSKGAGRRPKKTPMRFTQINLENYGSKESRHARTRHTHTHTRTRHLSRAEPTRKAAIFRHVAWAPVRGLAFMVCTRARTHTHTPHTN